MSDVIHASRQHPRGRQSRLPLACWRVLTGRQLRQPLVPRITRRAGCQRRRPRRLTGLYSRQRSAPASGSGLLPVPGAYCTVVSESGRAVSLSRSLRSVRLPFLVSRGRDRASLRGRTACFVRTTPPTGGSAVRAPQSSAGTRAASGRRRPARDHALIAYRRVLPGKVASGHKCRNTRDTAVMCMARCGGMRRGAGAAGAKARPARSGPVQRWGV